MMQDFWLEVIQACRDFDLIPSEIGAFCEIESGWIPWRIRFEPKYRYLVDPEGNAKRNGITLPSETMCQMTSWGLTQVMGGKARELGFKGNLPELCDPSVGIHYGAMVYRQMLDRWRSPALAASAYNAGTVAYMTDGKTIRNNDYVAKWLNARDRIEALTRSHAV